MQNVNKELEIVQNTAVVSIVVMDEVDDILNQNRVPEEDIEEEDEDEDDDDTMLHGNIGKVDGEDQDQEQEEEEDEAANGDDDGDDDDLSLIHI